MLHLRYEGCTLSDVAGNLIGMLKKTHTLLLCYFAMFKRRKNGQYFD